MVIASVVVLLLSALAATSVILSHRRRQADQQRGLALLKALQKVLMHVQTHRGVSTGFLKGASHEQQRVHQLQGQIAAALSMASNYFEEQLEDRRWGGINGTWSVIRRGYASSTASDNFERHNALVERILQLIDEVADEHGLNDLSYREQGSPRAIWKDLLVAAEYVGQARAIGNGVATAGRCDSVSRIRLSFLQQRIELACREAWRTVPVSAEQRAGVRELLDCVRQRLLSPSPGVTADEYFALCTRVMNQLYQQFGQALDDLQGNHQALQS